MQSESSFQRAVMCSMVAAVVAIAQTGCAVVFAERANTTNPTVTPECSASRGGVYVDGAIASLSGLSALAAAGEAPAAGIVLGLMSAALIGTAVSGSRAASKCVELREAHTRWLRAERPRRIRRAPERESAMERTSPDAARAEPTDAVEEPAVDAAQEAAEEAVAVEQPAEVEEAAAVERPAQDPPTEAEPDDEWSDFWTEDNP